MTEVRVYERSRLPEHQKAALRFTDAFVTDPGGLTAETRAELLRHFSPQQLVELTFKLVYHTANKALVALDAHPPVDSEQVTEFHYDEHGALVLHH
jgi:alkylhydroperoxidase family enzyme